MFKIGEKVVVKDGGENYPSSSGFAIDVMEMRNYSRGICLENGSIATVVAKSYHKENSKLIYGLEHNSRHYLVGEGGLEVYAPLSDKVKSSISSFVLEKKPFAIDLDGISKDIKSEFQKYLFSLGICWMSGRSTTDHFTAKFYDVDIFEGVYCLGQSRGNDNNYPLINLLTGEITNTHKELTVAEIGKELGYKIKVVK